MSSCAADVVIVTCNSSSFIGPCLESIGSASYRIIVVDNGSSDGTPEIVKRRFPSVEVVANGGNLGYGRACNIGFSKTTAEYVVLSNADVVYPPGAIQNLVDFLKSDSRIGVTAPQFVFPNGKWQLSFADTPSLWTGLKDVLGVSSARRNVRRIFWPWRLDRSPKDVPFVAGAVLVLPRKVFEEVGGFDEQFYFYADESDLCMRIRKQGWRVVFCPLVQVVHVRGGDSVRIDTSDTFVRHMVISQGKLARKHLAPWEAAFYMQCQRLFFGSAAFACRCGKLLLPGRVARVMARKIPLFEAYSKLFREYIAGRPVEG